MSANQLIRHHAQRIHIAAHVDVRAVALQLLGTHVGQGAQHLAILGQAMGGIVAQPRYAEIKYLGVTAFVDEDVAGLQVAMNHAAFVRMVHGARNLDQQAQTCFQVQALFPGMAQQVIAAHIFEREPRHLDIIHARLTGRIQTSNTRMLQLRKHFNLSPHALDCGSRQAAHHLERNLALRMRLLGQIDPAHAALAQHLEDTVRTNAEDLLRRGCISVQAQRIGTVLRHDFPLVGNRVDEKTTSASTCKHCARWFSIWRDARMRESSPATVFGACSFTCAIRK